MNSQISWVVFTILFLATIFCAGTTVNNDQEEFNIVQGAILQFQKDTGEFPTSWDDLWNNEASRPSVESLAKRRTDMIESFRFIAPGTTIRLPSDGSTIIGMMTRPMRPPPEIKHRLLVVRLKDGTRRLKQIEEEGLQRIFTNIGLNLADYTGPDGNWAPETRLRAFSQIPSPPRTASPNPSRDFQTIPALPLSKMLSAERKTQLWIAGGVASLALLAVCLVVRGRRERQKHL
ncbi:MAG: hypothetical protein ACRCXD_07010 [Luteolibacter sp.]